MVPTDVHAIPVVSVSYNSPELIEDLLSSFRAHYPRNPFIVIDGSDEAHYRAIEAVCARYNDVRFIHFDYNIHHGPGLAWAYRNAGLEGRVLVLDSDVQVLRGGLIEALADELKPGMYGVGSVSPVDEEGFDVESEAGSIRYLHPACMLCNIEIVRAWPMPTKHGAPNIDPMLAIHRANRHELIGNVAWVKQDFDARNPFKNFLRHDWQGTVTRTGGYHLEEWQQGVVERLRAKSALDRHSISAAVVTHKPPSYNQDLLGLMPRDARRIIEIGSNNGGLACAYKAINPASHYVGVEIDASFAEKSRRYCDEVMTMDVESADEAFHQRFSDRDVWVFGDVLEHLRDPWKVLDRIRRALPEGGCIVACLPNAQHWSLQVRLAVGDLRYEDHGLLDRTHLRFFTRATILEMFAGAGLKVVEGHPRVFGELRNERVLSAIRSMAESVGSDPNMALRDSLPLQYVVKAIPA